MLLGATLLVWALGHSHKQTQEEVEVDRKGVLTSQEIHQEEGRSCPILHPSIPILGMAVHLLKHHHLHPQFL